MANALFLAALPGRDVSSSDPNDFTIRSDKNMPKISMEGYGEVEITPSTLDHTIEVKHNLGYAPILHVFFKHENKGVWQRSGWIDSITTHGVFMGKSYKDANTIHIRIYGTSIDITPWSGVSVSVEYKYFLCVDDKLNAWFR